MKTGGKKNRKSTDDEWFRKNFPTQQARAKADEAIDLLDVAVPMHVFIDAWVAAYKKAGGLCDV